MSDAVFVVLQLTGDPDSLDSCRRAHFSSESFDFNSVIPMPAELNIEEGSSVTTGYEALFGDWTVPAKFWDVEGVGRQTSLSVSTRIARTVAGVYSQPRLRRDVPGTGAPIPREHREVRLWVLVRLVQEELGLKVER
jgi:hypothetical protein